MLQIQINSIELFPCTFQVLLSNTIGCVHEALRFFYTRIDYRFYDRIVLFPNASFGRFGYFQLSLDISISPLGTTIVRGSAQ